MTHPPTPELKADDAPPGGVAGMGLVLTAETWTRPTARPLASMRQSVERAAVWLLMLATAALVVRPSDLVPGMAESPVYEFLIAACAVCALPRLAGRLTAGSLRGNAITALVVLLAPAVVLSHLWRFDLYEARRGGLEMVKACVYFLLIVSLVDTPGRLRTLLLTIAGGVLVVTVLALLQYVGVLSLPALESIVQQSQDPSDPTPLVRLCGVGVFNDPNDFSLILVIAMVVCGYVAGEKGLGPARWAAAIPFALFAWALVLTHSRGGLMSGLAAVMALVVARIGWRNALPMAALALPVLLMMLGGRQTDLKLDDPEDSFQGRLELWNHSLDAFRSSPLVGIGQGRVVDVVGQVCHNSYLHAFVEMGLLGGVAFLGAFLLVARGLWKARPVEGAAARARPFVLAVMVGYAAGLLALSRCYTVPTLMVLAIAAAYLGIVARENPAAATPLSWRLMRRLTLCGVVFLGAVHVFVRVALIQVGS